MLWQRGVKVANQLTLGKRIPWIIQVSPMWSEGSLKCGRRKSLRFDDAVAGSGEGGGAIKEGMQKVCGRGTRQGNMLL